MVDKTTLKEIIVSNREYILKNATSIISREGIGLPKKLNKVVIFFGVRRSGKTFLLFEIFKKHHENSLYVDFEDECRV